MTTYSETFNFVYSVQVNDGHFTINNTKPIAASVNVSDDDSVLHHHDSFSIDTKLEQGHPHGHHEELTFVSRATDGAGDQGFIAKDGDGHYFFFTQDQVTGHHDRLSLESGGEHLCFMPGTAIMTPDGEVAVEELAIGRSVLTADGRTADIRWIGRQTVSRRFLDELRLPIRIKCGAFAEGIPSRDLVVSPDHALFVDGCLIQAASLVNGTSIVRFREAPSVFTYYHVEVENHALILAENTPAETFIDNAGRNNFDNHDEYRALHPGGRGITEMPYPRAKACRQVPRAIRERLAERGAAICGVQSAAA